MVYGPKPFACFTLYCSIEMCIYLKRLTFIKTSTKNRQHNELQWHEGSKRSTEIQKTPNVTKDFSIY